MLQSKKNAYFSSDDSCSTFIPSERLPLNLSSLSLLLLLLLRVRPLRECDLLLRRDLLLLFLSLRRAKIEKLGSRLFVRRKERDKISVKCHKLFYIYPFYKLYGMENNSMNVNGNCISMSSVNYRGPVLLTTNFP